MSIYAWTLESREEYPDTFYAFYNELQSAIKNVKSRDSLVIVGYFNAKIRTAALETNIYWKEIGIYGKGRANSSGYTLFSSNIKNSLDQIGNR